ncbi:MAG TPA: hypothetical protein VKF80_01845 [Candidatus Eisenbacteria bacterium]|nr:hypothetical protein [Candidatus Eisenbacteria bacterium]
MSRCHRPLRLFQANARVALGAILAGFFAIPFFTASAGAWTQETFILGMWGDPCVATPLAANKELNERRHRLARDARFNLLMGANSYGASSHTDSVIALCADNDLSTFVQLHANVQNPPTFDPRAKGFDRVAYTKSMADRAHFLPRKYPPRLRAHFYGYFLGDEPPAKPNYVALKNVLQDCKAFDPGALAFINLCPEFCVSTRQEYVAYAESLANDPNPARRPDVVSFDYYPFRQSGMVATYFDNLSILRQVAGDRPLWAHPLSSGLADNLDPTASQIRFMTNCPVAYGAKGLIYFMFNTSIPHPNPSDFRSGIVTNCDTVTPLYDVVKNINDYLVQVVAPVVMSSRLLGTYHVAQFPAGQIIPSAEILGAGRAGVIARLSGAEILCGVFDSPGGTYVWLVNKDIKNTKTAGLWLTGNRAGKISIGPTQIQYAGSTSYGPWQAAYDASGQVTKLASVMLAPGEGRMIRVAR